PTAEIEDVAVNACGGAEEEIGVDADQVSGDGALERQRRPCDEQRPGHAVPPGDERVARDEDVVAPGEDLLETRVEVDVAPTGEDDRLAEPDGGPEGEDRGQDDGAQSRVRR